MRRLPTLGWVDWVLLAVLALSVIVGLWRGAVFEVLSLAGWLVAYLVAQLFTTQVAPHITVGDSGSALNHGVTFAMLFVATLIIWAIAARLVRLLIHATPLKAIDRALGAAFGLLRGAVVLLALATVVLLTPAARSADWQASQGAAWLTLLLEGLKPMLPRELAHHLPA
jgi:membrane protein required for colicin V production